MSKDNFAIWLNGWVELSGGVAPTEAQWKMIKEHLALAFNKITPPLMPLPNLYNELRNVVNVPAIDLSKVAPHPYPGNYIGDGPTRNNIFC